MEKGGNNYNKGSEKSPKKGPKFNIYWVYALIGIALLAMNFLDLKSQPKELTGFKQFQLEYLQQQSRRAGQGTEPVSQFCGNALS